MTASPERRAESLRAVAGVVRAWLDGAAPPPVAGLAGEAAFIATAEEQRVLPLLHELLARRPALPAAITVAASRAYVRTLLRNETLLAAAARTTAALHAAGIAVARLKGSDLLLGTYASAGLRPMDDVDLLVPPADLERAVAVLEKGGFRRPAAQLPLADLREHHFHVALVAPDGGAPGSRGRGTGAYVEIHWELADRHTRGGLGAAEVFAGARPIDEARPGLGLRLAPHARLLHLALHVAKHAPFLELLAGAPAALALVHPSSEARLVWLVDLALVAREPGLDVAQTLALARRARIERPVWSTLRLVDALLGEGRIPAPLLRGLEPARGGVLRRGAEAVGRTVLAARSPRLDAFLVRAGRMDEVAQVRPLRLLAAPLQVFPEPGALARRHGWGRLETLLRYPGHVGSELLRGMRLGLAVARHRAQLRKVEGTLEATAPGRER